MSSIRVGAVLVSFALMSSGCAVEEILLVANDVVELGADAGSDSVGSRRTCRRSDGCVADEYCETDECMVGERRCGAASDLPCPGGSFCARLSFPIFGLGACRSDVEGFCVTLSADDCESNLGPARFMACAGDLAGSCTDFCGAVRTGVPHVLVLGNLECAP